MERQINSSLYERLALSRDKDEIRKLAEQGLVIEKAADLIKNPMVLEFLDLREEPTYSESELETNCVVDFIPDAQSVTYSCQPRSRLISAKNRSPQIVSLPFSIS